jgi:hypothetical protein
MIPVSRCYREMPLVRSTSSLIAGQACSCYYALNHHARAALGLREKER